MQNRNRNNHESNRQGFNESNDRGGKSRSSFDDGMSRSEGNDYRSQGPTYGSSDSQFDTGSSYSGSDYDYNRSGYRGDSSGFSGQNRGTYGGQQANRANPDRQQYGQSNGRFDQDYSTRRALEDREIGTNANWSSRTPSYDNYSSEFRDSGTGFSSNEGRWQQPYASDSSYSNKGSSSYQSSQPRQSSSSSQWGSTGNSSYGQQSTGQHSGKGPKGYRRSDERIKEEVCEALAHHAEIDASEVEVEVADGAVTLSGTVESRQIKRMTEDLVEGLAGVSDVKNDLRVMATSDSSRSKMASSFDSTKTDESMDYGKASATTNTKNSSSRTTPTTGKSVQ